jgi:anti-sigma regulatory factor (Ser/Thr protein kinase)
VGTAAGRSFDAEDTRLLELAADRVAVAIDRARVNEQAHHIAATLQRSLLPSRVPEVPGLEVATRYQPGSGGAQVGGDLFDVVPYTDGRVGLAIGDVIGRGVEAASLMGQLRNGLRAYALEDDQPEGVLERVNRLAGHWEQDMIATLLYLLLDPVSGRLRYANAGHLPPLVRRPDGSADYLEGMAYVPLGVLPFAAYTESSSELASGSTLVLYTDGLVEERGESISKGLERLRRAVVRGPLEPAALLDHLLETVPAEGAAGDDVAVLAVRLAPVAPGRLELRLPAEPESLGLMRRNLERWLHAVGASPTLAYDLTVAAGEACTNAVEHAYPPGEAVFELEAVHDGDEIEIVVRDFGFWRQPHEDGDRGRGIELMRRLTDSMRLVPGPQGTTVHLRTALREAVHA